MRLFNYCHDECQFNQGDRHYWDDPDEQGKHVRRSKSDASNKKLKCELGYNQTVNSHKALINSQEQGKRICPRLRKIFDKEVKG